MFTATSAVLTSTSTVHSLMRELIKQSTLHHTMHRSLQFTWVLPIRNSLVPDLEYVLASQNKYFTCSRSKSSSHLWRCSAAFRTTTTDIHLNNSLRIMVFSNIFSLMLSQVLQVPHHYHHLFFNLHAQHLQTYHFLMQLSPLKK